MIILMLIGRVTCNLPCSVQPVSPQIGRCMFARPSNLLLSQLLRRHSCRCTPYRCLLFLPRRLRSYSTGRTPARGIPQIIHRGENLRAGQQARVSELN